MPRCFATAVSASTPKSHVRWGQRFADQIESAPPIVAHHYVEAGLSEPAVRSRLAAAEVALSRSVSRLAEGSTRQSLELGLQLARANSLFALKGFNSAEAVAALTEAKFGYRR
jgi:hypothetical protein